MESTILYVHRFITSLGFTMIVESAVLFLLLTYLWKRPDLSAKRILLTGALASFSTIPYVWFVFPFLSTWFQKTSLYFSEPFAFVVEALIYRFALKLDWKVAFAASLVCNLASFLLGSLLRSLGVWIYW